MSYDPEGPTPDIDGDLLNDSGDADAATKACEECGGDMHEDADVCPQCGAFQLGVGVSRRSLFLKIGMLLSLVVMAMLAFYWIAGISQLFNW